MDQNELREWEGRCIQEEPPGCTAGCPLAVDARAFVLAMGRGDLRAAYAVLEKTMPLAGITARLCEAPCETFCLRGEFGGPIAVGLLEKACAPAVTQRGRVLCLPARGKAAAVLGAGPSSLVVAFDLAKKGYAVSVFPATAIGGWLNDLPADILPAEILAEEIAVLEKVGVRFAARAPVTDAVLAGLQGSFQTVYLGRDGELAGNLGMDQAGVDEATMALGEAGLFTGGIVDAGHPSRYITSIAQGRAAALSMDRFMQGVSLTAGRVAPRRGQTDLFTNTGKIAPQPRTVPTGPAGGFTREEAIREGSRCIDCQCLECVRNCVFLAEYKAYPRVYVRRVYNNSAIVKGVHQANEFINSCSLCRQCENLCPRNFSMADLCLEARQQMVREQRMPPSAHWFALEEMRSAAGETALLRHAPGRSSSEVVYFPGCQLAGIRPEQTLRLYDRLLELNPATGIWLDCCGAPAHWAGREEECTAHIERLKALWQSMGAPRVFTACSSCLFVFRRYLPECKADSVWTYLAGERFAAARPGQAMALTDPCTARHDEETRSAVRSLLAAVGQPLVPLEMAEVLTECCGYGGLMENSAPGTAKAVREARVRQSDSPFLTYCAMCRDQLARTGKPVVHLLDILFGDAAVAGSAPPVSPSARRTNRRFLQGKVLARHPGTRLPAGEEWQDLALAIPGEVAAMLEERRILEQDVRQVLFLARKQGSVFAHHGDDRQIASVRLGEVTFWVEYREVNDCYHIDRCWSHRMVIQRGGNR